MLIKTIPFQFKTDPQHSNINHNIKMGKGGPQIAFSQDGVPQVSLSEDGGLQVSRSQGGGLQNRMC